MEITSSKVATSWWLLKTFNHPFKRSESELLRKLFLILISNHFSKWNGVAQNVINDAVNGSGKNHSMLSCPLWQGDTRRGVISLAALSSDTYLENNYTLSSCHPWNYTVIMSYTANPCPASGRSTDRMSLIGLSLESWWNNLVYIALEKYDVIDWW